MPQFYECHKTKQIESRISKEMLKSHDIPAAQSGNAQIIDLSFLKSKKVKADAEGWWYRTFILAEHIFAESKIETGILRA